MKNIPARAPLNIVPFIDITLVLLCIVLSVSTFITQGQLQLSLPKSQTAAQTADLKTVKVEVSAQGLIVMEGTPCTMDELKERLSALSAQDFIELRLDEETRFGLFVQLIDVLKELDHENFSIAAAVDR